MTPPKPVANITEDDNVCQGKTQKTKYSRELLQELIEEATVDCYDESEQIMGLTAMIEEQFAVPFETKVLGIRVTVAAVANIRGREVVAICGAGDQRQAISIADLPLPSPPPEGAEWIAAYTHWASAFLRTLGCRHVLCNWPPQRTEHLQPGRSASEIHGRCARPRYIDLADARAVAQVVLKLVTQSRLSPLPRTLHRACYRRRPARGGRLLARSGPLREHRPRGGTRQPSQPPPPATSVLDKRCFSAGATPIQTSQNPAHALDTTGKRQWNNLCKWLLPRVDAPDQRAGITRGDKRKPTTDRRQLLAAE